MALGDVEEHKKIGRVLLMLLLAFASCNHIVKTMRLPLAGDRGALDNLSTNFNTYVIIPLDQFRLGIGEKVSSMGRACPESIQSTCEATTTGVRFVLGLH